MVRERTSEQHIKDETQPRRSHVSFRYCSQHDLVAFPAPGGEDGREHLRKNMRQVGISGRERRYNHAGKQRLCCSHTVRNEVDIKEASLPNSARAATLLDISCFSPDVVSIGS